MTRPLLVIGYGNTLRRDDGVGVRVAESVAALGLAGVRALPCAQLTPELADSVSQADAVVFVDADAEGPQMPVRLRRIVPADTSRVLAHAADPSTLLALARDVFGRVPPAWWLTVPAEELGFGDQLSAVGQRGLKRAVTALKALHRRRSRRPAA